MNNITPKFIPKPPKELTKWLLALGCFSKNYMIFKCGWDTDVLSGKKSQCLDVVCSKCGANFKAARIEDNVIYENTTKPWRKYRAKVGDSLIQDDKESICPHCGAEANCVHVAGISSRIIECEWPLVLSKKNGAIIMAGYRVMRTTRKDGNAEFKIDPYEAYVFDGLKAYRFAGWYSGGFGVQIMTGLWEMRKSFLDYFQKADFIYYTREDVFENTYYQNCKFDIYSIAAKEANNFRPISYLQEFKKHPQLENLVVQGYGKIVAQYVERNTEGINWQESSPRKMLGLSKTDFNYLKNEPIGIEELRRFCLFRSKCPLMTQEEVLWIAKHFAYRIEELLKENNVERLVRYIKKQKHAAREVYSDWKDYIRAAEKLGYDVMRDLIRFPKNFGAAHDRVLGSIKYKQDPKLILKFQKVYQELQEYSWEKDGLIIRPAASEDELIFEGKELDHCVGGYGEAHCTGRPIFFIRKANEPDVPYYTLQLDLTHKAIVQNRGYENNRNRIKPPEIDRFAKEWLNQVVKAAKGQKKKKQVA